MRVLLVYTNQSRELVPAAPVGLSYVASATRAAGHEVRLLDLAFSTRLLQELGETIDRFAPDVVGVSVRNIDNAVHQRFESPLAALREQLQRVREHAAAAAGKPVPLVLGGPAISILGERALDLFDADHAVIGEGEEAFPALLDAIERGVAPTGGIAGVCSRGAERRDACAPQRQRTFAASGMQQWVDWPRYEREGGTWPIQSKRGCPLTCSYCVYPLIEGRRTRLRDAREVADEIEQVLQSAVRPRAFEFVDSTFNVPSRHAIDICEELVRRRLPTQFTAMGINPLDVPEALFPLMKKAGFNSVMITPEAGNDTMLAGLRKGFTMRQVQRCRDLVAAARLPSMWFFMLGAPGETPQTIEQTIRFAEQQLAGRRFVAVFFVGVRVLPGTALAAQLVASGELAADADLSEGRFYLSPAIDEAAVIARLRRAIAINPSIVHVAESTNSGAQAAMGRLLHRLGVAPPYWRHLPHLLRLQPLRYLRNRFPAVTAPVRPEHACTRRLPAAVPQRLEAGRATPRRHSKR